MQNQSSNVHTTSESLPIGNADVSSRFSLLMLTSRLLTLQLQLKEAHLTMGRNPNQYTDNEIIMLNAMIEDLSRAVAVLQNGY